MSAQFVGLVFEHGFDENDEAEAEARGYRSHVWVELSDGTKHPVTFFDIVRLQQELDEGIREGRPYFAEPGLIVLSEVTHEAMESAARALVADGLFATRVSP